MSVGTSTKGKRACTKEPVDISSGKFDYSYHGFPIEEEGLKGEIVETGALGIVLVEAWVLETEMLEEYKEVSEKYTHVQTMVKNRK